MNGAGKDVGGKEGSGRLGGARADFVAGLGRKVSDLRSTLGRVRYEPDDLAQRDELRRKLHALASAAKLMKFDAMDRALSEGIGTIDRSPIDKQLDEIDLDCLEQTIEDLPALAWGDGRARSSRAEETEKAQAPTFAVLVVGTALIAEALLEEADDGKPSFTCECTPDAQAAFDLVRANEPHLVVLDADTSYATELVEAMMDDATTESLPIVVVGSFLEPGESARYVAMGVSKTLPKPTSREALRAACEEAVLPQQAKPAAIVLGEPTLDQLSERLAAEIKEALLGKADDAMRATKIPLGEGSEVLGAMWGAIARVREVVTARTDGAVRFPTGQEGLLPDGEVARSDRARQRARSIAAEVRLQGRRVVIADDDPAVVWFLADLLKTAGFLVHEAFDGRQALDLAYETSPDLVLSDVLMPKVDGYSLCRALRRDVALRDTPVILLSWKEDLLQRVRELGAGAAGYVRKEADTRAIVARVREALRPRARIEARLRDEGEVRGRLDTMSVRTLLEIVCATRPEARVSVRDASFLYEVEIRCGAPQRVTRTAGDGSFLKGTKALAAVLGASAGRFTVTTTTTMIEQELDGNLPAQLAKPIAKARAATALLTGPDMTRVDRVRLDEEGLADYLRATPERARIVARELAAGAAPRSLVLDGICEGALLDDLACDLAARGIVTAIETDNGEDLLGPMVTKFMLHSDARASFAPRTTTPSPVPALNEACPSLAEAPICDSPMPATALEDAVLREMVSRSPEPVATRFPTRRPPVVGPANTKLRMKTTPPPPAIEGTPPADQIIALGEPTVIDSTTYEEKEASIPIVITEMKHEEALERRAETPFVAVAETSQEEHAPPKKKTRWSLFAFFAVCGIALFAMNKFAVRHPAPKASAAAPPPVTESIPTTDGPAEGDVPAGHGVLEVAAPPDAVVMVDGKERARGHAKFPMTTGAHDVRVRTSSDERGCGVDVRASRVVRVKF